MNSLMSGSGQPPTDAQKGALKSLQDSLSNAESRMQRAVDTLFVIDHDKDGLAASRILEDWLAR